MIRGVRLNPTELFDSVLIFSWIEVFLTALIGLFTLYFCSLHLSVAAMEILAPLITVPALLITAYKKKFIWPSKWVLLAFGGLLFTTIASFFANQMPISEFENYAGDLRWMLIYVGFMQFFQLTFKDIAWQKILLAAQTVLIIAGVYSIYQFFFGHDFFRHGVLFHKTFEGSSFFRPNGFFSLPTTYAYTTAMFFCISLAFWMREPRPQKKWRMWIRLYFALSSLSIFLTFTRAAWIAFTACTLGVLGLTRLKFCFRVSLVFLLIIAGAYTSMPTFQNRINSIFDPHYVANHDRIYLWKATWQMFKDHPLFGVGLDQSKHHMDDYLNRMNEPKVIRSHPHNTYLNFLSGLGIFGLLSFLLFVGWQLKSCIHGIKSTSHSLHRTFYIGVLGLQLVLLIGGFTECTFEDIEMTHPFILFAALIDYLTQQDFPRYRLWIKTTQTRLG